MRKYKRTVHITKLASGGYMTAALSKDGELFIWGRSNPGCEKELADLGNDKRGRVDTMYEGQEYTVKDVAVGFGHILYTAHPKRGSKSGTLLFAAGQNDCGQLFASEPDFQESFLPVLGFGEFTMKKNCLWAAGFSSWVVRKRPTG
jgi:alpha-tubulin suppressor-like RCC1 family protein